MSDIEGAPGSRSGQKLAQLRQFLGASVAPIWFGFRFWWPRIVVWPKRLDRLPVAVKPGLLWVVGAVLDHELTQPERVSVPNCSPRCTVRNTYARTAGIRDPALV